MMLNDKDIFTLIETANAIDLFNKDEQEFYSYIEYAYTYFTEYISKNGKKDIRNDLYFNIIECSKDKTEAIKTIFFAESCFYGKYVTNLFIDNDYEVYQNKTNLHDLGSDAWKAELSNINNKQGSSLSERQLNLLSDIMTIEEFKSVKNSIVSNCVDYLAQHDITFTKSELEKINFIPQIAQQKLDDCQYAKIFYLFHPHSMLLQSKNKSTLEPAIDDITILSRIIKNTVEQVPYQLSDVQEKNTDVYSYNPQTALYEVVYPTKDAINNYLLNNVYTNENNRKIHRPEDSHRQEIIEEMFYDVSKDSGEEFLY